MSYTDLWKRVFPKHFKEKYQHESGLSGGGGEYPVYDIHLAENFCLPPMNYDGTVNGVDRFGLAHSLEYFDVPDDVVLLTKNKSTIARMGVDAAFSTFIDNGFKGYLTIEIVNHSFRPIVFNKGQPILQVFAVPLIFSSNPYAGKYQNQENKPVEPILGVNNG